MYNIEQLEYFTHILVPTTVFRIQTDSTFYYKYLFKVYAVWCIYVVACKFKQWNLVQKEYPHLSKNFFAGSDISPS